MAYAAKPRMEPHAAIKAFIVASLLLLIVAAFGLAVISGVV